jgi:hypothetical protein
MYAKVGRACFQHRRAVLVSWLVVFIVGIGVGSGVLTRVPQLEGMRG